MSTSYHSPPNLRLSADDGIEYAYRDAGQRGGRALILLQHLRRNLDNWDPAQRVALARPTAVGKVVLASTAPEGAVGLHNWDPNVTGAIGSPQTTAEGYLSVFFTASGASRSAGQETLQRI